jgi:hypothetical protein
MIRVIYELRIYRFHPGKKKTFLGGFKKAKSFMKKYGVNFIAAWENPAREDEFIWIRAFPTLKAREKATRTYYNSPEWLKIVGTLRPTIRRREVRIMKALPYSTLR